MSKKLVKRTVDLANLPPLTRKQKAELAALSVITASGVAAPDDQP